jgi:hypothetical protein
MVARALKTGLKLGNLIAVSNAQKHMWQGKITISMDPRLDWQVELYVMQILQ